MKVKKAASTLLKIAVSAILIAWIIRRTDTGAILKQLSDSRTGWILLIVLSIAVTNLGQIARWRLLLPADRGGAGFPNLLKYHMFGIFFQSFLPSTMTVDVIKGYLLSKDMDPAKAYGSVAFGKIIGVMLLAVLLTGVILFRPDLLGEKGRLPAAALAVCLLSAAFAVLFSKKISRRLFGFFGRFSDRPLVRLLMNFRQELYNYRFRSGPVALSGLISVVIMLASICGTYFSFLAVGYETPFSACLVYLPVTYALMLLPVSINGIGVREGFLLLFFRPLGLTPEILIASSILAYAVIYGFCLAGGLWYIINAIQGIRHGR